MELRPPKRYRDMSQAEKNLHMARCRLLSKNTLHYLLYVHGLVGLYREMIDGTRPFAVLSAQPTADALLPDHLMFTRDREKTTRLRMSIRDSGRAYLPAWSTWVRAEGEVLTPDALFAPGMSRSVAIELGRDFGQDAVIWSSGADWWRINPKTGAEDGPFPTSARLRPLVLERLLEQKAEEITRSSRASRLVVGPGRQGFFFYRGGGGLITCGHAPFGVSVHDVVPGPRLHADYDDPLMGMGSIDAYLPLSMDV